MTFPLASSTRYLLDTNILIAYARGIDLYQRIENEFGILALARSGDPTTISLVSLVSIAEITSFALYHGWGRHRLDVMQAYLSEMVIVPVDGPDLIDRYARIDVYSTRNGHAMGKNDLWIATAANLTGATLLTTDRDFDHLHGNFISRVWIDPILASGT